MNKQRIIIFTTLFGFGLIVLVIFVIFNVKSTNLSYQETDKKDAYYDAYKNIKLSGKIIKKTSLDNDRYSLYEINIAQSSVQNHDLRDSLSDYFLVIHGDSAKMVYYMSYTIFINDSVDIDYEKRQMLIFRKHKLVNEYMTPPFSAYYISMRKKAFGR